MPKSGGRPDSLKCLKETSDKTDHQARFHHNRRHRPKEIVALAAL